MAEPPPESIATSTGTDWNGPAARHWVDHDDRYDALLAGHDDILLAAADPRPGERLVDIGCGCGTTTLRAARAIAPAAGEAVGVDISRAMLERARARAAASGADNVTFRLGDAQSARLGQDFDLAISRYGVMFFRDHTAAFANIRAAMRRGGRLAFLCWADRSRNEHWTVPHDALAPHLGLAAPTTRPSGPFALADPERVLAMLAAAGWKDVDISAVSDPLWVGRDAADAVAFELSDPQTSSDLAGAGPAVAARAIDALRVAFAARQREDGVWLAAAAWLVHAVAA